MTEEADDVRAGGADEVRAGRGRAEDVDVRRRAAGGTWPGAAVVDLRVAFGSNVRTGASSNCTLFPHDWRTDGTSHQKKLSAQPIIP